MPNAIRTALMADCAAEFGRGPSGFFNHLYADSGTTVWLVSKDWDVVWHSDNNEEILKEGAVYLGKGYTEYLPEMLYHLKGLGRSHKEHKYAITCVDNRDYVVTAYPLITDGIPTGYLVTLSEDFKARLNQFLDKQKKREDRLCQISSALQP